MYSALCLQPGAQFWQGKKTRNGQQQGKEWAKKNPRSPAVAGGLPGWPAHQSLASELPGTQLAGCQQLWPGPFAESQGDKTDLVLRETQSGLFRKPCSNLDQDRQMISHKEGALRSIMYNVHYMHECWAWTE